MRATTAVLIKPIRALLSVMIFLFIGFLLWTIVVIYQRFSTDAVSGGVATTFLKLHPDTLAVGGVIEISYRDHLVEVESESGQSAADVAANIARIVNNNTDIGVMANALGATVLFNSWGVYACSQTEMTIGIPPQPRAFQCRWNAKENAIEFTWRNPDMYDFIEIVDVTGIRFNRPRLGGDETRYTHRVNWQLDSVYRGKPSMFGVVGILNGNGCKVMCEYTP